MSTVWLAAGTVLLNLPFGYWRSRSRKFGLAWILCVHAPVPLVILARTAIGVGWGSVPFLILAAVAGQFAGGRLLAPVPARGLSGGSRNNAGEHLKSGDSPQPLLSPQERGRGGG